eukprot:gnl/MRDRNA2_/MRDRNA2_148244_c0_seq1.p1 gnl/MRDRNA2_/MRDRNA2_148244_c0~~gnl/MRDRNA2_/MRDRNA2_148244_c0_seq1.p1  ORF type:complete len:381 (+),score=80.35 gnl/MRDRNA2_/MRDRNA2_148244_c0_seq1:106-1143(+)
MASAGGSRNHAPLLAVVPGVVQTYDEFMASMLHRTRGGMMDRVSCAASEIATCTVANRTQVTEMMQRKPALLQDEVSDGRRLGHVLFRELAHTMPDLDWVLREAAKLDPESVNVQDRKGRTLLHECVGLNRQPVAKTLLSLRADVEISDKQGRTPFMEAAWLGKVALVEVLLQHGVSPSHVDLSGRSALHITTAATMVKVLLTARADVNLRDEDGKTPLFNALFRPAQMEERVQLLLKAGAEPNVADNRGRRPLHEAAGLGRNTFMELLLDANAEVDAQDSQGDTALHMAKDKVVAGLLVAARAQLGIRNQMRKLPLDVADTKEVADILRSSGAPSSEDGNAAEL